MSGSVVTIDVGNTNAKVVVWSDGRIAFRFSLSTAELVGASRTLDVPPDTSRIAIASVVPRANEPLRDVLSSAAPGIMPHFLSARDMLPIQIAYSTPATLGADRIAAALGAHALYPDAAALIVVDAGTAVTYEVLVGTRYLGGAIAPGPALQLESLARGTAQLPRIDLTDTPSLIGSNTASSIASGIWWGFVTSVDGMLTRLRTHLAVPATVVLTGGWAERLARHVTHDALVPDLVHEGLSRVVSHGWYDAARRYDRK